MKFKLTAQRFKHAQRQSERKGKCAFVTQDDIVMLTSIISQMLLSS